MSAVGFVVHEGRLHALAAADAIKKGLHESEIDVVDVVTDPSPVDLVVAVGGDGTFLRAAHIASGSGVPVLGVKVGRLGFLTEVDPEHALGAIVDAVAGRAVTEERLAVEARPDDGESFPVQWGMNEIMVEKKARHRLVRLRMEVDGAYVTTFSADGVIVATPTGSTAYSFSARGPIVSPNVPCLVVTPIAAHMVFDRSFVLTAEQLVTLEVVGDEPAVLSADGRESEDIPVGTRIRIGASARPARFVRGTHTQAFLTRVRDKFGLPGDPADRTAGLDDHPAAAAPGDVGGHG